MYDKKQKLISFMPKNNTVLIEGPVGVHVGSVVRKTMDSELNKTIEEKIRTSNRQSIVNAVVSCSAVGKPMVMEVYNDSTRVSVSTEIDSVHALKRATDEETLNKQFSKTKDSWASFGRIEYHWVKTFIFRFQL